MKLQELISSKKDRPFLKLYHNITLTYIQQNKRAFMTFIKKKIKIDEYRHSNDTKKSLFHVLTRQYPDKNNHNTDIDSKECRWIAVLENPKAFIGSKLRIKKRNITQKKLKKCLKTKKMRKEGKHRKRAKKSKTRG